MLRHRLDAVHARAEIDAIQVQLEDLLLAETHLDQHGDDRLFRFPRKGGDVGEEERARQLLGQRAAALGERPAAHVADHCPRQPDGIDARVGVEPAIFDGDDGMLEIGGDLIQRDVAPLFIEPEPGLRVGAVEDRVADASRQTIDRERITGHPPQSWW